MNAFLADLEATLVVGNPQNICHEARTKFNAIIRDQGLPIPYLTTRKIIPLNLPLANYPKSFLDDLETLLLKRQNPDLFDEEAVARAHSPITLRNVTAHVRQALGAAVSAGKRPEDFQSLADQVIKEPLKNLPALA
jgi:hypothetical protein